MNSQKVMIPLSFALAVFSSVNAVVCVWMVLMGTAPVIELLMIMALPLTIITVVLSVRSIAIGLDILRIEAEIREIQEGLVEKYRRLIHEYGGAEIEDRLPGEKDHERLHRFKTTFVKLVYERILREGHAAQPDLSP